MNTSRKVLAGMVTAAALAASATFVQAQPQGGPASAPGAKERGTQMHQHGRHGRWSNPKAAVEGYLASLKVELKITPQQENAWQAFAGKVRAQADQMVARREKFKAERQNRQNAKQTIPAPERLAQRTERMKVRVANMEAMTVAVRDLYSVLTPEQKTLADQQLARRMSGGHRGHGGFGGHGGHHFRRPAGGPGQPSGAAGE